jgi:hypothetical protein
MGLPTISQRAEAHPDQRRSRQPGNSDHPEPDGHIACAALRLDAPDPDLGCLTEGRDRLKRLLCRLPHLPGQGGGGRRSRGIGCGSVLGLRYRLSAFGFEIGDQAFASYGQFSLKYSEMRARSFSLALLLILCALPTGRAAEPGVFDCRTAME